VNWKHCAFCEAILWDNLEHRGGVREHPHSDVDMWFRIPSQDMGDQRAAELDSDLAPSNTALSSPGPSVDGGIRAKRPLRARKTRGRRGRVTFQILRISIQARIAKVLLWISRASTGSLRTLLRHPPLYPFRVSTPRILKPRTAFYARTRPRMFKFRKSQEIATRNVRLQLGKNGSWDTQIQGHRLTLRIGVSRFALFAVPELTWTV
jgi:hypothetical protein